MRERAHPKGGTVFPFRELPELSLASLYLRNIGYITAHVISLRLNVVICATAQELISMLSSLALNSTVVAVEEATAGTLMGPPMLAASGTCAA